MLLGSGETSLKRTLENPYGDAYSRSAGLDVPNPYGNPAHFHLTLKSHEFINERSILITLRKKTTISGLRIQTTRENYVKSFRIQNGDLDYIEYPRNLEDIEVFPGIPLVIIILLLNGSFVF